MDTTDEILDEVAAYPPSERAAAIAHYVYMLAAERHGWDQRVPTPWNALSSEVRAFNIGSVEVWAEHTALLNAWNEAIAQAAAG